MEKRIVLAGGCFWGVEAYFKQLKGVIKTSVGYVNGNIANPTYEDLCNHRATHAEACEIIYENSVLSLSDLLKHLFRFIDPFSINRQGHDIGLQYRTGIYYQTEDDYLEAKQFIDQIQKNTIRKVQVEIKEETKYYLAETYHQDYLDKNPGGYCHVDLGLVKKEEKK